jgi:hypothetical protein
MQAGARCSRDALKMTPRSCERARRAEKLAAECSSDRGRGQDFAVRGRSTNVVFRHTGAVRHVHYVPRVERGQISCAPQLHPPRATRCRPRPRTHPRRGSPTNPSLTTVGCAVVAICPNDETVRILDATTWEEKAKLAGVRVCVCRRRPLGTLFCSVQTRECGQGVCLCAHPGLAGVPLRSTTKL